MTEKYASINMLLRSCAIIVILHCEAVRGKWLRTVMAEDREMKETLRKWLEVIKDKEKLAPIKEVDCAFLLRGTESQTATSLACFLFRVRLRSHLAVIFEKLRSCNEVWDCVLAVRAPWGQRHVIIHPTPLYWVQSKDVMCPGTHRGP